MPAPFPPNDTALVRFRYTKAQPAGKPTPPPAGSPPGTPPTVRPEITAGTESTEMFELDPPTNSIAEVEKRWREANGPDSDKDWQDASFPDAAAPKPEPAPLKPEPDVDAQGVRHRAAGMEELPGTVTETADAEPVKGKGRVVQHGGGQQRQAGDEQFGRGDTKYQLSAFDDYETADDIVAANAEGKFQGIGEATAHEIVAARKKRDAGRQ